VVLDQKASGKIYLGFLTTKNASRLRHRTWLPRVAPDLDACSRSAWLWLFFPAMPSAVRWIHMISILL